MDKTTINQNEYTQKTIKEAHNPYLPIPQLQVGNSSNMEGTLTSVSHEDFQGKQGEAGHISIHGAMHLSTLSLSNDTTANFPNRAKSHEDFGLKIGHRSNPIRQENQLKIDTTCNNFF